MSESKKKKTIHNPFAIHQMFQCFVITLLKWMKYKDRLTFAYYSITFLDFKSLQSVSKILQVLKAKTNFFLKISKYGNTVFYENPNFSLFFPEIIGNVWCWKYRFPTTFFSNSRNTVLKIFISRPPTNTTKFCWWRDRQNIWRNNLCFKIPLF